MAALICESIGKACTGLCSGCGAACGGLGKACGSVCTLPCKLCGDCCKATGEIICTPFFPYLALTALLNLPALGFAVKAATQSDCDRTNWLYVNCALCLIHVVMSIYIVRKIQKQQKEEELIPAQVSGGDAEAGKTGTARVSTSDNDDSGSRKRMKDVLCYDPGVAIYLLLALVWLGWLVYGYAQLLDSDGGDGCDTIQGFYYTSLTCGTLYAMMVGCTFCCSFLCLK